MDSRILNTDVVIIDLNSEPETRSFSAFCRIIENYAEQFGERKILYALTPKEGDKVFIILEKKETP